ncbi:CDP-alcohol phosphatidyltransferase [Thomasclavelia spiroformis DSM 1552]|uniref:CDP-alcohol phosphatidyltransferase n=2 Tax=Thomasclavelia spiroformis TaxID=29348 RepID=B1C587_9FIRM|nr:CDP-alcohol phosphatidyltransferase [Thomasclavelia spiroformis DSM 1552]
MAGIHLSFNGMYQWAFICLIMCGICDTFDGMVARSKKNRTDEEKRFGIQIDSLCDLVAFGVFPAILGYNVGLSSIGWLAIEIFYVLAAVIRLAYFNVKEETRQQETDEKRKYYQGLPVTTSSFILPLAYAFRYVIFELSYLYGALMLITGILFIVDFKVPKVQSKGLVALGILVIIELIQIVVMK